MPHVTLQIVDDEDRPLPAGEAGNIRARAPTMARGVFREDPDSDRDRIQYGWAYPGDIGVVDEHGFLTLLGRASDVIIRGGVNVHPSEVEAALAKCPGVREVAVAGVASARQGEEIAAFIVADPGVMEDAVARFALSALSPDRRPRVIQLVREIPRNAAGKVLRTALRDGYKDAGDS
jgi:acyl-CoA synthetase (AMP-forming)/AMP-acid ligase II